MLFKTLTPFVLSLVVGLVSCDARDGGGAKTRTKTKSGTMTSAQAGSSARTRPRPRPRPPAREVSGWLAAQRDGPTLPSAVRGAPFGVHASKAKGVTLRSSITGVGTILGHNHRELEIKVAYNVTSDRVGAYRISVEGKTLERLKALWGAPQMVVGQPMWFNAKAGLRVRRRKDHKMFTRLKKGIATSAGISAVVKVHTLIFEPYIPFKTLLGPGKGLAFLPKPILGRTVAQIKAAYPERFAQDKDLEILQAGELQFPPTEYTVPASELFTSGTSVTLEAEGGRITCFTFEIGYKDAAHKAEIFKVLTQKLGTPKQGEPGTKYMGKPPLIFPMGGGLQLAAYKAMMGNAVVLKVSRAR